MQLNCPKCRAGVEVSDDTTDALFLCPMCDVAEPQPEERASDAEPDSWKFERQPVSGIWGARLWSIRRTAAVLLVSCSVGALLFGYLVFSLRPPRAALVPEVAPNSPAPPTPLFEPVSITFVHTDFNSNWIWRSDAVDRALPGSGYSRTARIESFARTGPHHDAPNKDVVAHTIAGLRGSDAMSDADLWGLPVPEEPFGLDLSHTRVTADGLWALGGCDNLRLLLLADEQVTDDVLQVLRALGLLHTLAQAYPAGSPGQWHNGPKDVRWFALAETRVTAAGLAELAEFPCLSALWLHQGQVSAEGVRALAALPTITQLCLSRLSAAYARPTTTNRDTEEDNDSRQALRRVAGLAGLTSLDLRHYDYSPDGPLIGELIACKNLRHLVVDAADARSAVHVLRPNSLTTNRQRDNLRTVLAKLSTLSVYQELSGQDRDQLARAMPTGRVIQLPYP